MSITSDRRCVPVAAALLGAWLVIDIGRQSSIGVATTDTWLSVLAAAIAVAAAVLIARDAQQRRMALLVLWWVTAAVVGSDVATLWPGSRVATTLLLVALAMQAPAYVHMALAYPSGRVDDRLERAFVIVGYVVSVVWELPPALFVDASACPACTPHASSLLYTGHTFDIRPIGRTFWALFVVLGIVFLALIVRRLSQAPPGALRTLFPLALAAVFAGLDFIFERIVWLAGWSAPLPTLDRIDSVSMIVLPAALLAGAAAIRRGPVGDLVVELGRVGPGEIRAALARAIGDPSLELALWLPDQRRFVDERGRIVHVDRDPASRTTVVVGSSDEPVAAIVHDPRLAGQRPLLEAAGAAARLALENARLQAELRAQLVDLQESRSRIVDAADAERRRLERDLHDGAQQRLLALGLALQLLDHDGTDGRVLEEARTDLQEALRELRELARGIHPAVLTERGLAAAIGVLVDRAPIPVTARVTDERHPPNIESAVYFVVSEALANVAKHANATRATVAVRRESGHLVAEISDDGSGGATIVSGGGLQGLADRVGAVGGVLRVTSPPGTGTTLRAEIPCAS